MILTPFVILLKKMGIFSKYFVENVHMCKKLNKFHVEQGFCQYKDCLTKSLHTVSVLTKLFLLGIFLVNILFISLLSIYYFTYDNSCTLQCGS